MRALRFAGYAALVVAAMPLMLWAPFDLILTLILVGIAAAAWWELAGYLPDE